MMTIIILAEAEQQLGDCVDWWKANRGAAPTLVIEEFERCVTLLTNSPDVGTLFQRSLVPGVRRLVMPKTRYIVYYLHDEPNAIVYVLAVWGGPRRPGPTLRDPR